jgi:hypothetical protein
MQKTNQKNLKTEKSLSIEVNNNSVKRVEVAFTHSLNLDSLIKLKENWRKLELLSIIRRLSLMFTTY